MTVVHNRSLSVDQVHAAAEAIVDADGWNALTIAAVARAVGVKGPSLYNHLAGLDEIRAHLQARTMASLSQVLREAAMGRSGGDALRSMCDAFRRFALAHPNRYMAMAQVPVDPELVGRAAAGADAATRAALRAFDLTEDEAVAAQLGLFATAHGFVSLEITGMFPAGADPAAGHAIYEQVIDRFIASFGSGRKRS